MNHLDFVLWMIGWPAICWFSRVWETQIGMFEKLTGKKPVDCKNAFAVHMLCEFAIWVYIGYLIWK